MQRLERAIEEEVAFVNRLLIGLHQQSLSKFWKEEGSWSRRGVHDVLKTFQPFHANEWLEKRLPSKERLEGRLLEAGHLLFLDFVEKDDALPILDMSWDLRRRPEVMIRFRFFLLHWAAGEEKPRAVGFRLEAPEGPGTEGKSGNHDYWHGQMIAEFKKGDDQIKRLIGDRIPRWIPTKQPAFPLPAKSMGDLLAVLLLSLYGVKQLRAFRDLDGFGDLKHRLSNMGIPLA